MYVNKITVCFDFIFGSVCYALLYFLSTGNFVIRLIRTFVGFFAF